MALTPNKSKNVLYNKPFVEERVASFLQDCGKNKLRMTVSRLCLYLNVDKAQLERFIKKSADKLTPAEQDAQKLLRYALQNTECYLEDCLFNKDTSSGAKFSLQNNFGWSDKQTVQKTQDTTITINWGGESALLQGQQPKTIDAPKEPDIDDINKLLEVGE